MDSSDGRDRRQSGDVDSRKSSTLTKEQVSELYPEDSPLSDEDIEKVTDHNTLLNARTSDRNSRRNLAAGDGSASMQRRARSQEIAQPAGVTPQAARVSVTYGSEFQSESPRSSARALTPRVSSRAHIRSKESRDEIDFRAAGDSTSTIPSIPGGIPECAGTYSAISTHAEPQKERLKKLRFDLPPPAELPSQNPVLRRIYSLFRRNSRIISFLRTMAIFATVTAIFGYMVSLQLAAYIYGKRGTAGQKSPIYGDEKRLDHLYSSIVSMAPSASASNAVFQDQLGELAAQLVDQLTWLDKQRQPPLPVVFVTMPDDNYQPIRLQRCFIDELVKIISQHAGSRQAVASETVQFQKQRTELQLVQNSHKVSPLLDHALIVLQNKLGNDFKDYGLKIVIGEQLDTLPSTELAHLSPLFPLLSGDTPDRRFVWAFTLSKAPLELGLLDSVKLSINDKNRAIRRSMEQYLSSVWLNSVYTNEKLDALYSRLVTTIMIPSAAARDFQQCVKGA